MSLVVSVLGLLELIDTLLFIILALVGSDINIYVRCYGYYWKFEDWRIWFH